MLEDIVVLSMEQAVAAPFATRQLADLGARVIKVERPQHGDFARDYDRSVLGQSSYFVWLNRGKESIELDLKNPGDRAIVNRMVDRADVVVQNLAPGAASRLGLGAESLRAQRPELVHCSISGYGSTGPYQRKKAYDLLLQCETGLLEATGSADEPAKVGISVADIATGMYAYSGILAALYERTSTGQGATLEVSMLDSLGEWMCQPAYYAGYGDGVTRRSGARHLSIAPYGPFRASDGVVFLGIQNDREWSTLCRQVLDRPELVADPRFCHNPERVDRNAELTALLEARFIGFSVMALQAALDEAGIANAEVRTPAQLLTHPQLEARQRWRQVQTPAGEVSALAPPVVTEGREPLMRPVPALGQHNHALRSEFGGAAEPTSTR
ncbi:MAG: itaconate CoA-transferase [Nocardioidaceae bacterium]|nr:itaconate CoA-transferase [Nocardioidaceae bacterium]